MLFLRLARARCLVTMVLFLSGARASPLPNDKQARSSSTSELPVLKLPYASYRASRYNELEDIYTFTNIRYAAPPVGDLRWAKPAPPPTNTTLQDGSYGPACVQTAVRGVNLLGSGNTSPVGAAINQFLGGIPVPLFDKGSEDCLFLDVYVPGKALRSPATAKLPVLVWIYGGGYLFGSKDALQPALPMYDGSGLINQADGGLIFVAMNYRLGAYGFLAGTTMEREALPNAGLWDQRAALQWVQDYIGLVGGDPTRVTAMGESAGAGSLMHHMVANGGGLDPLFSRAILQSPAYQWMWDRAGMLENAFQTFAELAGCGGDGAGNQTKKGKGGSATLACLRAADTAVLKTANTALMDTVPAGSFAVGPSADGSLIRQLPVLELATGHFATGVEALLLSHVSNEATVFVDGSLKTDADFAGFLGAVFPNSTSSITEQIRAFYPPVEGSAAPVYATESARVEAFLRDSCFTCHVRHLTEGYGDSKVWNMQYAVSPGWHASDLLPTFFNPAGGGSAAAVDSWLEDAAALLAPVVGLLFAGLSRGLQSYFASFVTTGDPNTHRVRWNVPWTTAWPHPTSGGGAEQMGGVLNVGDLGFSTIRDTQDQKTPCDFWRSVAAAVTSLGGYAPPGAVVAQTLVDVGGGDPSAHYVGGNGNSTA